MSQTPLQIIFDTIRASTHNFFESMCPLPLEDGENTLLNATNKLIGSYDIISTISITGQHSGAIAVHVPRVLGEKITCAVLGMDSVF